MIPREIVLVMVDKALVVEVKEVIILFLFFYRDWDLSCLAWVDATVGVGRDDGGQVGRGGGRGDVSR